MARNKNIPMKTAGYASSQPGKSLRARTMRRDNGSDRNPGKIAHSLDSGGRSGAPVKVTLIYRAVVATRPRCLSAQYPQSLGPRLGVFYVSLWEPRALSIAGRPGDHRALRAVLS